MENSITPIFIVGIIFATVYGIIKILARRQERITMIEKGTGMPAFKDDNFTFSSLKFGILFIGLGIGVLTASILSVTTTLDREVAYFSMIFLFGGVSLLIYHFTEGKKVEK